MLSCSHLLTNYFTKTKKKKTFKMFEPVPKHAAYCIPLKCYKCRQEFDEEYEKTFGFTLFLFYVCVCVCVCWVRFSFDSVGFFVLFFHSSFVFHEYFKAFVITLIRFKNQSRMIWCVCVGFSRFVSFSVPAYLWLHTLAISLVILLFNICSTIY